MCSKTSLDIAADWHTNKITNEIVFVLGSALHDKKEEVFISTFTFVF